MLFSQQPLQLEVYPMLGYRHPKRGCWRLLVQGRVSRPSNGTMGKRILLKGLVRALRSVGESGHSELFERRVEGFMALPEKGRRVYLEVGGLGFRLRRPTKASGLFSGRLDLPDGIIQLDRLRMAHQTHLQLPIKIRIIGEEQAEATGEVFLAQPTGLSIVSDIDDTIKSTHVTSRLEMLAQTFSRPFQSVEGMAGLYQDWAQQGAMFHYVSSSPWQMYPSLAEFLTSHRFPAGSIHLRWFRLRDEMFKRWRLLRKKGKGGLISSMIKRMPYRRFLLVGDSGERDPEIYAKLADLYPESIAGILIRNLAESPIEMERLKRLKRKAGMVSLQLFEDPSMLRNLEEWK